MLQFVCSTMPFIENVARGSAEERTVCTLQGVTQKGKCKEKRFEVLPEAKKRLADKAYSIRIFDS